MSVGHRDLICFSKKKRRSSILQKALACFLNRKCAGLVLAWCVCLCLCLCLYLCLYLCLFVFVCVCYVHSRRVYMRVHVGLPASSSVCVCSFVHMCLSDREKN